MDFFDRQERSRRTSRGLVLMFLAAFVIVALATTVVVAGSLRLYMENNSLFIGTESWQDWLAAHFSLIAAVAAGTLGVMGLASLYRAATLARGGSQVARMLGASEISGDGGDPLKRRLVNVVEEMALASGLPVPAIFVLEQEAGINAFAAGLSPHDAAITVTRGALEHLDRAELQGVIAHEFSHILNGDMRLNQQLIGLSFGILVLSLVGRWLLRSARYTRRSRNSGAAIAVAIGFALVIIGGIGMLASRLIKAGVSRQRERLADAAAVQFTREPTGLAGALKKIGGYSARITSVDTEEVAHMLFEHGSSRFSGWFATHPPLIERIRALEPNFDPRDLGERRPAMVGGADSAVSSPGAAAFAPTDTAPAELMLERAGEIGTPEVGRTLRAALPDEIYQATHSRDSSVLLAFALTLSPSAPTRQRQLGVLEQQLGTTRARYCARLASETDGLAPDLRLPIVELLVPALKQRPAEQLGYMFSLLERLAQIDNEPRLFDYALVRVLRAYLHGPSAAGQRKKLHSTRAAVQALLSVVAAFGHSDGATARTAYEAGIRALGAQEFPTPPFEPLAQARDLGSLDEALAALSHLRPRDKARLLEGVRAVIQADTEIATAERELFRVIAATLDCPLPPGS